MSEASLLFNFLSYMMQQTEKLIASNFPTFLPKLVTQTESLLIYFLVCCSFSSTRLQVSPQSRDCCLTHLCIFSV